MSERSMRPNFSWALAGLIAVLGCAPGVTSRGPEYSKPVWTVENPGATKDARQASRADGTRERSRSSLDALREGRSPATPPSSPVRDIYFDFDRYDLSSDARATLKANAEWLKSQPSVRVQIEGHCDERGTNEYNLALGAKRAQSARDYLVTLGVAAERLSMISFGEEIPVCTDRTESCWARNRRARFVIVPGRPAS